MKKLEPDDPKQSARFVEAAKTIKTDESDAAFEKVVKRVLRKSAPIKKRNRKV